MLLYTAADIAHNVGIAAHAAIAVSLSDVTPSVVAIVATHLVAVLDVIADVISSVSAPTYMKWK